MPDCIASSSGNGDARSDGSVGGFSPSLTPDDKIKMQKRRGCKKLRMSFLQPRKHAGILAGMLV